MRKFFTIFVWVICIFLTFFTVSFSQQGDTYVLNRLNVEQVGKTTYVTIGATDNIKYNDTMLDSPHRIIIDCQGAIDSLPSYDGNLTGTGILSISSSQINEEVGLNSSVTRIVLSLQEKISYIIMGDQSNLIVAIDAVGFGETEEVPLIEEEAISSIHEEEIDLKSEDELSHHPQAGEKEMERPDSSTDKTESLRSYQQGRDFIVLDEHSMESEEDILYSDKTSVNNNPISLYLVEAEIRGILRSMADFAGVNIVAGDNIKGKVTVILNDVPWRQALDVILKTKGYGIIEEEANGILRVVTATEVDAEKKKKYRELQEMESLIPLQTHVLKIKYAEASDLFNVAQSVEKARGDEKVTVDSRTNSLIISGTPSYIDKVTNLITKLDTHTPQIVVQAKVISITPNLMKEYGIRWGVGNSNDPAVDTHFQSDVQVGTTGVGTVSFGTLLNGFDLDALFSAIETKGEGEILSEPRITVLDNDEAEMVAGLQRVTTITDNQGNILGEQTQDIGVILNVSPHVIANDKVLMDLDVEVSSLGGGDISLTNRDNVKTKIIVDNNATAVIGGLMRTDRTRTKTSVPILGNLPLFGKLFRKDTYELQKRELMIFVTPSIVRPSVDEIDRGKEDEL